MSSMSNVGIAEKKSVRVSISKSEIDRIIDFQFSNRIGSRHAALREVISRGLDGERDTSADDALIIDLVPQLEAVREVIESSATSDCDISEAIEDQAALLSQAAGCRPVSHPGIQALAALAARYGAERPIEGPRLLEALFACLGAGQEYEAATSLARSSV